MTARTRPWPGSGSRSIRTPRSSHVRDNCLNITQNSGSSMGSARLLINSFGCEMETVICSIAWDNFWDEPGEKTTVYRNRVRQDAGASDTWTGNIGLWQNGTLPDMEEVYVLENVVRNLCNNNNCGELNNASEDYAIARNLFAESCNVDAATGTHGGCTGLNNSPFPTGTYDNNVNDVVAPGGWSTYSSPDSLVYSEAPSWWCQEAVPWGQMGARFDDYDDIQAGTAPKLPAQILAEGGTCTPLASTTPGSRHEGVSGSGSYSLRWPTMQEGGERPASVPFAAWLRRMAEATVPWMSFVPESPFLPFQSPDAGSASP